MNFSSYNTPRNRLALTYLGIIMVLSISFSFVFYHETTFAARTGFRRQTVELRDNLYFAPPGTIERIRDDGINDFNDNILARLVVLNLGMLLLGSVVSYYLAKKSLEPMEEALASQSRFTSDAAHELRTPLTAMKTEIEVGLRGKKVQPSDMKAILTSNLEEIAKLETLTDALLRLAKNGNQADNENWSKVKITAVIKEAASRIKKQASERDIKFDLPPDSPVTINADAAQLTELFVILFDNAVKYGSDKTTVNVMALQDENTLVISVADKGIGINEADLPHIFERFYRADQSRTKNTISGYGLGLSVAQAIVKAHNGNIEASSQPGVGTTFTITLPRV